jgi:hypothetical protein
VRREGKPHMAARFYGDYILSSMTTLSDRKSRPLKHCQFEELRRHDRSPLAMSASEGREMSAQVRTAEARCVLR